GQDGSYLAEFLLNKGYEVHGLIRHSSTPNTSRIDHIKKDLRLIKGDITDLSSLFDTAPTRLDEIYHLAAQSDVGQSFISQAHTRMTNIEGTANIIELANRDLGWGESKLYNAATSEMFGSSQPPQNEDTPFHPCSPYGVSKLAAYWSTVHAREAGLHASSGILFNHESPRRGENFVTRKTTKAVARIKLGLQDKLVLGNLDARRDWGHAKDYVEAMWLMLQQEKPDDYVISTGVSTTVRQFCEMAFETAGIPIEWDKGQPKHLERAYLKKRRRPGEPRVVQVSSDFYRPLEVNYLKGDSAKARKVLGWKPSVGIRTLVKEMVEADLEAEKGCQCR
ncbi:hypothetical protein LCGC14_2550240, partial [marine sediment metagenome]